MSALVTLDSVLLVVAIWLMSVATARLNRARENLAAVARDCADFPQARAVAEHLLVASIKRQPVDVVTLRRDIADIERRRDAFIIEQTRHWSAVQAKVAADARLGEPLPSLDGGAR